jgi:hypothetical protein
MEIEKMKIKQNKYIKKNSKKKEQQNNNKQTNKQTNKIMGTQSVSP